MSEVQIFELIMQVGGIPALILIGLFYMYHHGPKRDIEDIKKDVRQITDGQNENRARIQRLEIIADMCERFKKMEDRKLNRR